MESAKTTAVSAEVERWSELFEQHRRDIQALDRRILHLTCERLALAKQIGELKSSHGIPLRNFKVEAMVRRRFAEACEFLGLDPKLGNDLALFLIQKAVELQATMMDMQFQGSHMETLIIGGKGGMGAWIARLLHGQGHRIEIIDPGEGEESPFPEAASLTEGAAKADLIILAVPMSVCPLVLEELAALKPRGIVAEMCSLKSHFLPQMNRLREQGMRLVSFHPLFGPDTNMLSGRTIIFCTEGDPDDIAAVRNLFEDTTAELVEMDSPEHDRRMGLVLGLTHLSNLAFARALVHSGVAAEELGEVAGSTFQKQLKTTREVVEENPALYFEIQALNPITPDTARWLQQAVGELVECVENNSGGAFATVMQTSRDYLAGTVRPKSGA